MSFKMRPLQICQQASSKRFWKFSIRKRNIQALFIFYHCLSFFILHCPHCHPGMGLSHRRRAYSTNQITNYKPTPRIATASDSTMAAKKNPLRKTNLQHLANQISLQVSSQKIGLQVFQLSRACLRRARAKGEPCLLLHPQKWGQCLTWQNEAHFSSIFGTPIYLTHNDTFLIIIPSGQWHSPFFCVQCFPLGIKSPHLPVHLTFPFKWGQKMQKSRVQ